VAVVVGAVLAVSARKRRRVLTAWQAETRSAVEAATVAAALIPDHGGQLADLEHWAVVKSQVEEAAASLEAAGSRAPSADAAVSARTAAQTLRDAAFAVESDRLLREGEAPTPSELTDADAAIRHRSAEIHGLLDGLAVLVNPQTPTR
jgi:hypothetical protein